MDFHMIYLLKKNSVCCSLYTYFFFRLQEYCRLRQKQFRECSMVLSDIRGVMSWFRTGRRRLYHTRASSITLLNRAHFLLIATCTNLYAHLQIKLVSVFRDITMFLTCLVRFTSADVLNSTSPTTLKCNYISIFLLQPKQRFDHLAFYAEAAVFRPFNGGLYVKFVQFTSNQNLKAFFLKMFMCQT